MGLDLVRVDICERLFGFFLRQRFAVVIGPEEWTAGDVRLKNLASGVEERTKVAEAIARLRS